MPLPRASPVTATVLDPLAVFTVAPMITTIIVILSPGVLTVIRVTLCMKRLVSRMAPGGQDLPISVLVMFLGCFLLLTRTSVAMRSWLR